MSNINNAQISGRIVTPFKYIDEQTASLTTETLSIVGTAAMGPAFVPQQIRAFDKSESTLNTWENIFGSFNYQEDQIGPIAANIWLRNNGQQLTYTRVLGIGDGLGLNEEGRYVHAGFVVGDDPLKGSINDGIKGDNKYSVSGGRKGRTHFFGSYVKNLDLEEYVSPYNDYLLQLGINDDKVGIVTDVVFAAKGTEFYLQSNSLDNLKQDLLHEQLSTTQTGVDIDFGDKVTTLKEPKIYLQGQKNNSKVILEKKKESDKYLKTNYFENTFNTTPDYYLQSGNLCYASFNNTNPFELTQRDDNVKHFVASGKSNWNEEVDGVGNEAINYESFESIFKKARTPWIVSQPVYREENFRQNLSQSCKKLFRFWTYTDGKKGNKYRFRIKPRRLGDSKKTDMVEKWSIFDLIVYKYNYKTNEFLEILSITDLNLNPKSEDYICKKVGTEREYYDLDLKRICHEGQYKKTNNHFYVEVTDDVEYIVNETELMPSGFFPYPHINISNSTLNVSDVNVPIIHNPIQYVANMKINDASNNSINYDIENTHWGVEFLKHNIVKIEDISLKGTSSLYKFAFNKFRKDLPSEYNFYHNYTKYFQDFREQKVWITPLENGNADTFNDFFHLEKILYLPLEDTNKEKWNYAFYRRDGIDVNSSQSIPDVYQYVNIDEVLKSDSEADSQFAPYLSFDFFTYGGFDGINILDENKRKMNNVSCLREYDQEVSGETKGQTTYMYEVAKDIALDTDNFRCDIFSIPGINTPNITKDLVNLSKEKANFAYLFDVIDYDDNNNIVKNEFYYNNLDNNIKDILDEDLSIKTKIINGTENSIINHNLNNFDSRYSIATLNLCEASISDTRLVIPSSLVFINSLSQSSRSIDPVDSIDYTNNTISIVNPINSKFLYYNNDFDKLLLDTKQRESRINPIGVISSGKKIKPLSANTLNSNNTNLFSLFHVTRTYLEIKRELRNLLLTRPIVNNNTVLFSLYSETNMFSNIKAQLISVLEQFFEEYRQSGQIKNYFIDLSILDTKKSRQEKLDNTITGTIGITFYGNSMSKDFNTNIQISNILNDINEFTDEQTVDIINVNN